MKTNGQDKVLSCVFYVATHRAGQAVHVLWDETTVQIVADDGGYIASYPRPASTGMYYGPRTPGGTRMKRAGNNTSASITGTAVRRVSKGGYIGVLANKFYVGYKRKGEKITATWDAETVTLTDANEMTISQYPKPEHRQGWHGLHQTAPSTKS